MMKRYLLKHILLLLSLAVLPLSITAKLSATLSSPSGNLTLTVGVDNTGHPYYRLSRGKEVIL